jgi:L-threonylcarbamoyladenylate synthase
MALEGAEPAPQAPALGLRVPRLEGALAALAGVGAPVLQSSANLSGEPAPRRLADVPVALREGADLLLDGGELPGTASTVLDLSGYERDGAWRVVREGPVKRSTLERLLR